MKLYDKVVTYIEIELWWQQGIKPSPSQIILIRIPLAKKSLKIVGENGLPI